MKRQELLEIFPTQTYFSSQQVRKFFPSLTSQHLYYRQQTAKIVQIRRGWYAIRDRLVQEEDLREIANHIYHPSYVSLETALRYYNFIPEIVPSVTSITTRKTQSFVSDVSIFYYHSITSQYLRGYELLHYDDRTILMAEPEKAIIDYLYYHHEMDDADAFDEWRIDSDEVRMVIDREKLEYYGQRYSNQKLRERVNRFIAYIYEDVV